MAVVDGDGQQALVSDDSQWLVVNVNDWDNNDYTGNHIDDYNDGWCWWLGMIIYMVVNGEMWCQWLMVNGQWSMVNGWWYLFYVIVDGDGWW